MAGSRWHHTRRWLCLNGAALLVIVVAKVIG